MTNMTGKTALVTGAARGIGLAIAERLAADGARVLLCDIDDAVLAAGEGLGQPAVTANVASKADVGRIVADAISRFGQLDVLVNNAGIVHRADLLSLTEADFDRVMAINVKGALFGIQAAAPHMIAQGSGSIVNLSSVNAVLAIPDQIPYVVSKGALKQLTNVAALALAPHNVRVNAVGPGTILTDMSRAVLEKSEGGMARVLARTPIGRAGETGEIAGVVAFLASDDASYITGQTIYADGGRLGLNYTMPPA